MKTIDHETVFSCPVCALPFDIEEYYQEEHEGHMETAWHELGVDCMTCEDTPFHCQYYMEGAIVDSLLNR